MENLAVLDSHAWSTVLGKFGIKNTTYQSGSLLYLVILLAGSNIGYGLPSVTNGITSNQYFKVRVLQFVFFFNN